jgi:hypothetical protein
VGRREVGLLDEPVGVGDQVGLGDAVEQLLIAPLALDRGLLALGQVCIHRVQLFHGGGQLLNSFLQG